jgi:DNA-directed RNA polymerase subunit N (RpoN/RPB10)
MKINCISCGHKVDLDDTYDDYEGPVKCYVCGVLLAIKMKAGRLKSMDLHQPVIATEPLVKGTEKADKHVHKY